MGHNHQHISAERSESNKLIKITTSISVITALLIILVKIYGFFITYSLGIMASLIDSSLDIVASIINMIAARYAMMPPDDEHRFGHGKAEDLAVFFQSVFFNLSAAFLFASSVQRLFKPTAVENSTVGIVIMAFSCLVTIALLMLQTYAIRKTKSKIVMADRLHYFTDLLSNGAILVSLFLGTILDSNYVDPIFALGISIYLFKGAYDLLKPAFMNLMDHELSHEDKKEIIRIINSHPKVKEFHDLKTRYSGNKSFIQFHLELDAHISLKEAYDIASTIERDLLKYSPEAEIMIRKEPVGIRDHIKDYKD